MTSARIVWGFQVVHRGRLVRGVQLKDGYFHGRVTACVSLDSPSTMGASSPHPSIQTCELGIHIVIGALNISF